MSPEESEMDTKPCIQTDQIVYPSGRNGAAQYKRVSSVN